MFSSGNKQELYLKVKKIFDSFAQCKQVFLTDAEGGTFRRG